MSYNFIQFVSFMFYTFSFSFYSIFLNWVLLNWRYFSWDVHCWMWKLEIGPQKGYQTVYFVLDFFFVFFFFNSSWMLNVILFPLPSFFSVFLEFCIFVFVLHNALCTVTNSNALWITAKERASKGKQISFFDNWSLLLTKMFCLNCYHTQKQIQIWFANLLTLKWNKLCTEKRVQCCKKLFLFHFESKTEFYWKSLFYRH